MTLPESFLDPDSLKQSELEADEEPDDGHLEFEIGFFDRVLRRSPDYVDVLRCQGELLSRIQRHADALKIDRRLATLCPDDSVIRYNLACSLAMEQLPDEAIRELQNAFERGYDDLEHLAVDSDIDTLRDRPEFQALLREFGSGN